MKNAFMFLLCLVLELSNYLEAITTYETNCDNYTDSFGAKEKAPLE